jgi:predicted nucleotidyltransferase component of viral defense system
MSKAETAPIALHRDTGLFREAVNYTAAETAFVSRLIEKDYFCSVALEYLASRIDALVFRGGTCLAKVHAGFYRLSEDLDFVIPVPIDSSRAVRRARVTGVREALAALPGKIPAFRIVEPWTGANNSTQYVAALGYTSLLNQQEEIIKIEVSLREPLLVPALDAPARTILLDPISGSSFLNPVVSQCLSMHEAYAEKFRAALTRREIAVRDFYDIDHAFRRLGVLPDDAGLVAMVRKKLAVPGTGPVDLSRPRLAVLREQLESQLKPVLRDKDFAEFQLERAMEVVTRMAQLTSQADA